MKKKTTRKKMDENVDQHVDVSLLMSNLGRALDELRLDDEQRVKLGSVLKPLMMHVGASTYAGGGAWGRNLLLEATALSTARSSYGAITTGGWR